MKFVSKAIIAGAFVGGPSVATAQELEGYAGVAISNAYVSQGLNYNEAPTVQPYVELSYGGVYGGVLRYCSALGFGARRDRAGVAGGRGAGAAGGVAGADAAVAVDLGGVVGARLAGDRGSDDGRGGGVTAAGSRSWFAPAGRRDDSGGAADVGRADFTESDSAVNLHDRGEPDAASDRRAGGDGDRRVAGHRGTRSAGVDIAVRDACGGHVVRDGGRAGRRRGADGAGRGGFDADVVRNAALLAVGGGRRAVAVGDRRTAHSSAPLLEIPQRSRNSRYIN